jgi:hypothetical protein
MGIRWLTIYSVKCEPLYEFAGCPSERLSYLEARCNGRKAGTPTTPCYRQECFDMWILAFELCEGSKAALFAIDSKLRVSFLI